MTMMDASGERTQDEGKYVVLYRPQ
jgi:hypothetical protein